MLLYGQIPTAIPFVSAILAIINHPSLLSIRWFQVFLFGTLSLTFLSLYFLFSDRKLKFIRTNLKKDFNDQIVELSLKDLKWKTNKLSYRYDAEIPFAFGQNGYLIKILTDDIGIYYNVRNIGTTRGRMPFMFGFETLKANKFKRQIKLHTTSLLQK